MNAKTWALWGLAVCLVVPAMADAQSGRYPRNGACFYRDADYRGESACVDADDRMSSLPRGLRNEVSSIRVFGDVEVVAYDHTDFEGKSLRFSRDVRDLQRENWNDKMSSVEVRGRGYGGSRPGYRPGNPTQDADVLIRRAYQDLLDREPDQDGLRSFRRRIIDDGWTEQDVRAEIRRSPEYRERNTMTYAKAQDIVRRAYQSVLNREPDPASRGFVDKVYRDKWTQQDVERELRRSPEYLNRPR